MRFIILLLVLPSCTVLPGLHFEREDTNRNEALKIVCDRDSILKSKTLMMNVQIVGNEETP